MDEERSRPFGKLRVARERRLPVAAIVLDYDDALIDADPLPAKHAMEQRGCRHLDLFRQQGCGPLAVWRRCCLSVIAPDATSSGVMD